MLDPLNRPVGPNVPQQQVPFTPRSTLSKYPSLQVARNLPLSEEWLNDVLNPKRVGTFQGGANIRQLVDILNPMGFSVNGPRPDLRSAELFNMNAGREDHFGNFQADFLDLSGTFEGFMRAAGLVDDNQPVDPGFNVSSFLQSKDIDPFGVGPTGAPARLADYANPANWVPVMLARQMLGDRSYISEEGKQAADAERFFAFQGDPRYWTYLRYMDHNDDDSLHTLAHGIATDSITDPYVGQLEQMLFDQMKKDRDEAQSYTSGNPRLDWMAKAGLQADLAFKAPAPIQPEAQQSDFEKFMIGLFGNMPMDPLAGGALGVGNVLVPQPNPTVAGSMEMTELYGGTLLSSLASMPFMGTTQVTAGVPIKPETEAAWNNMTLEQREEYINKAGVAMMGVDISTMLVGFGGLGALRALAVAGKFANIGVQAARVYDITLKTANITMATGLINATANFALEATVPNYEQDIGQWIDASRPISSSYFAGAVNAIGYLGSGTYGAAQAAKMLRRGAGVALDLSVKLPTGIHVPRPIFGAPEIPFYRTIFGGARVTNMAIKISRGLLTDQAIRSAVQRGLLSETLNVIRNTKLAHTVASWEEALTNPASTHEFAALARSDRPAFFQAYERALQLEAEATPGLAERMLSLLGHYHDELSPWALEADEATHRATKRVMKTLFDSVTQSHMQRYGTKWEELLNAEDIQNAARKLFAQMDVSDLDEGALKTIGVGPNGLASGRQFLETLYQTTFDRKFAKLLEVAKATKESSTVSLGSLRNLFGDEIESINSVLRGADINDPALEDLWRHTGKPMTPEELMQWVFARDNVIEQNWDEAMGPAALAARLEDLAASWPPRRTLDPNVVEAGALNDFQKELEAEGNWTVIYKPRRKPGAMPTEAGPVEQGITGRERAQSDFASVRRIEDPITGKPMLFKSPWIEYPMGSMDQIELGNRGTLASILDSTTMGTRAWRIGEFQRANLHRILQTRYSGLTEGQINRLHRNMQDLASHPVRFVRFGTRTRKVEEGVIGGHMKSMQGWAWSEDAVAAAEDVFGTGGLLNRKTGKVERPEWNDLLARAYQQSNKLNLLAGFTSGIAGKANPFWGSALTTLAEDIYLLWRFGMSPIFKISEYGESALFNLGRGVYWDDPMVRDMILNSVGRNNVEPLADELMVGTGAEIAGIGQSAAKGSKRAGSHQAGQYAMTRLESSLAKSRQTQGPWFAHSMSDRDLADPLFRPNKYQLPDEYPLTVPEGMIEDARLQNMTGYQPWDLPRPIDRNGKEDMQTVLRNAHEDMVADVVSSTTDGINTLARVNPYLGKLADEIRPAHVQPLRMRASAAEPQFQAPVILSNKAINDTLPSWGPISHTPGDWVPAISVDDQTAIHDLWAEEKSQGRVTFPQGRAGQTSEIEMWADNYLDYRIGSHYQPWHGYGGAPPPEPARWAGTPQWQRMKADYIRRIDEIPGVPAEGDQYKRAADVISGQPVTPAAVPRFRQIELQHEYGLADPNETFGDVFERYINDGGNLQYNDAPRDMDWEHVEAIFLERGQERAWNRFLDRLPEGHPAREAQIRWYEAHPITGNTQLSLNKAMALYHLERAGMADMMNRTIGSLGFLSHDSETLARNLIDGINRPDFVDAIRAAASEKAGNDVGLPMIRTYLRWDKTIQGDQLVVAITGGDGRALGLNAADLDELWATHGLPTEFAGLRGDLDPQTFLRQQDTRHAIAFEPVEGTPGRLQVYEDPATDPISATIDANGNWVDPNKRGIPIVFGTRFVADASYQPLDDLYPRFEIGRTEHVPAVMAEVGKAGKKGSVDYIPHEATQAQLVRQGELPTWGYTYERTPNYVDVTLNDAMFHSYQWEEQLRDVFRRFRKDTVRINLPDQASADALQRLWIRGELPENAVSVYRHIDPVTLWADQDVTDRVLFGEKLAGEGYWLHGSGNAMPGGVTTRPTESLRPYYGTERPEVAESYAANYWIGGAIDQDVGHRMFVAEPPKNPVIIGVKSAERDRFGIAYEHYIQELEDDHRAFTANWENLTQAEKTARIAEFEAKHPELEAPSFPLVAQRPGGQSMNLSTHEDPDQIGLNTDTLRIARGDLQTARGPYQNDNETQFFWDLDQRVDQVMVQAGYTWPANETTQLGARGATITVLRRNGWDAISHDYEGTIRRPAGSGPERVMVYVNGRPPARTIEEMWAREHPATDEMRPLDLATMRTRMGVPEDVANAVPKAVGEFEDISFTGEAQMANLTTLAESGDMTPPTPEQAAGWSNSLKRKVRIIMNPVPFKLGEQAKLEALLIKNTFADFLKRADPKIYNLYTKQLKVPHRELTKFKLEDRYLYQEWVRTGSREDHDALLAHASKFTGETESIDDVKRLYESLDWAVLTDLWLMNARAQTQEAFTTHFFSSYRSALERSLNHPVLGVFPLSWAYKAGREWATFMFNNRMFGFRIGMTPAVVLKHIQRAEDEAWAKMQSEEPFGEFASSKKGQRFSAVAYIANLMLPGDWSSIPFPLAWPVRSIMRGDFDPNSFIGDAFNNWGISRDGRLAGEALGEVQNWLRGPQPREASSDSITSLNEQALYYKQHGVPPVGINQAKPAFLPQPNDAELNPR